MNIEIAIPIFLFLIFFILIRRPVRKLWNERACPSYQVEAEKKLVVDSHGDEVRILILSDVGSGSDEQRRIAEAAEKTCEERGCDFVLLGGDNFIQQGITCVNDEQLESKFESMYGLNVPFFAVLGNHDLKGNWRAQIDYTLLSERWNMPAVNYEVQTGPVLIQAINTTCSVKSLWRLYKKSDRPWRLGLGHHPAISSGRHGGMTWLERTLVAFSRIDFFVSGHNHAMEHLVHSRFDQIVAGGGGSSIEKSTRKQLPQSRFFLEDFGYIWAHITSRKADFYYFDISGKERYSFTKEK
jgi:tartrate-resistant acid phosphatase type 5